MNLFQIETFRYFLKSIIYIYVCMLTGFLFRKPNNNLIMMI